MSDPIARLARDLKEAFDRYNATPGARRCEPGCPCPLERTLVAMNQFVGASVAFDRGDLLPPHQWLPFALVDDDDDDE